MEGDENLEWLDVALRFFRAVWEKRVSKRERGEV
jgi:hypothetical protein